MLAFGHLGLTAAAFKTCSKLNTHEFRTTNYIFVFLGALLPDLIDKPSEFLLNFIFYGKVSVSGRLLAHTLVFSLIIILAGCIIFYRSQDPNMLILGIGSLIHIQLDLMWLFPSTYLYPFLGLDLPIVLQRSKLFAEYSFFFSTGFMLILEALGIVILVKLIRSKV
ncbi:MAG: metal-dependent hydrolase [Bacillota bacterium]|nr:metal-dependent hydrolase [Bacillota bacterium]